MNDLIKVIQGNYNYKEKIGTVQTSAETGEKYQYNLYLTRTDKEQLLPFFILKMWQKALSEFGLESSEKVIKYGNYQFSIEMNKWGKFFGFIINEFVLLSEPEPSKNEDEVKENKRVSSGKLPTNQRYTLIDKTYVPIIDGGGASCDNCGQIIARIATVESNGKKYHIGFDCLENILVNNTLLDGFNAAEYEEYKSMIPKAIRLSKQVKGFEKQNPHLEVRGIYIEEPSEIMPNSITFHYLYGVSGSDDVKNYNTGIRFRGEDLNFDLFVKTAEAIMPHLKVLSGSWKDLKLVKSLSR